MSGIDEGLAELGQGSVTAAAVEPAAATAGHTHETTCLNCGTALVGSHCHACGQAAHVHRTLGAFFHDLLHGVFHFEGKVWRTLPLLVWRPGRLTREYIDGRRASYVSPIALFLFFVFLMFAVFHATQDHEVAGPVAGGGNVAANIARLEGEIAQLRTRRQAAADAGRPTDPLDAQIEGRQDVLDTLRDLGTGNAQAGVHAGKPISSFPMVDKAIRTFQANPELAIYKLQTYAYKYSWALIPISVPFLWLLFPFSRRFHLYDHTVFVTYSLCFMTLLAIAAMVLGALGPSWVVPLLFFAPPIHMYRQLRGAYGLARFGALWRTVLLLLFATTALLLFVLMIMAQSSF
ncbi:DUF3667 domain-containing protein [Novosphingobium sp. BL-52-GroH]|uniref:DUF3667 domain-containing protein n=1 Tax=Novosphingobium sp. BL-52-GroH TaxID=3349877 RepID=UPI00384F6924